MPCTAAPRGLLGSLAPRPVQRAFGDLVLLRNRAELLALRIAHQPLDLDRLLAALRLAHHDRALDAIGARRPAVGQRRRPCWTARAGWQPPATCCRRPARRSRPARTPSTGPSRPMLPVVVRARRRCCDGRRRCFCGRCLGRGRAGGARRTRLAPTPAGRRRSRAARGDRALAALRSAARRRSWLAALPAIDCATCGVIAAHGSLRRSRPHDLLAGDAVDALAGGVGDVPDVGDLGGALVLGGDDVAAQRVVDALFLRGRRRVTRWRSTRSRTPAGSAWRWRRARR